MVMSGKIGFTYVQNIINGLLSNIGLEGLIPETPLAIMIIIMAYELISKNIFIINMFNKGTSSVIFNILGHPLVRELLNYRLNVDPSNVEKSSIELYEWGSKNTIRVFVFTILMIFLFKILINKLLQYTLPFVDLS